MAWVNLDFEKSKPTQFQSGCKTIHEHKHNFSSVQVTSLRAKQRNMDSYLELFNTQNEVNL